MGTTLSNFYSGIGTPTAPLPNIAELIAQLAAPTGAGMVGYSQLVNFNQNTIGYKLAEIPSVKDAPWNVVPDGNSVSGSGTDWGVVIQSAINTCISKGVRVLYIPSGVYKIGTQISVPANFVLFGAGMHATYLFAPNAFNTDGVIKLAGPTGPPCSVFNLSVLAQNGGAGPASYGINMTGNGSLVHDVWVGGFSINVALQSSDCFLFDSVVEEAISGGTGISITSTDTSISNISVYNNYIGISISNVNFLDGTVTISDIRTNACGYTGFLLNNSSNIQITNCSGGNPTNGKYANSFMSVSNCSDVILTNVLGRLGTTSTTANGLSISGGSNITVNGGELRGWKNGVYASGVSGLTLNSVQAIYNGQRGIWCSAGDRINIVGCTGVNNGSAGTTDAGLYLENSASSSLYNVTGGIYTQNDSGSQDYGIYANLTDNGPSTGYIHISNVTATYNNTADVARVGAIGNIKLSDNLAPKISGGIPTIASATTLTFPLGSDVCYISGTTNITSITAGNPGKIITLIFLDALTVVDGNNLILNNNMTTTTSDTLTLISDGTNWTEMSRSAN